VKVQTLKPKFLGGKLRACLVYSLAVLCLVASLALASPLRAQSGSPHRPAAKSDDKRVSPAESELRKRLEAAQAAQRSGDAAAVALANGRLIALALREMGQLRLLEAAYPQAEELYRRSLDLEDLPDTRVDLAIAELQGNQPEAALSESDKALAADPTNARAFSVRGRAWIRKQEYAKAAEALDHAVQLHPDLETSYSLGICLLQTKDAKDRARAAEVFERIVQTTGDSGSLHVLFGRAYRDAADMPAAILEFQRAVGLDTRTPHAHYFLGLARLAVNEWKATPEVRAEFSKELEFYPRDYLANYMVGFLASNDRDYGVSDRYLKIAAEVNPDWPEPWLYLGLNAYAQSDMKRAEECFRKAITLTGSDESRSNYQIRRAYVDLGRILVNSGRAGESEVYLAKARDLQNKTMEQSQQNVAAMALAGGAGSAAAIVPLSLQNETEAAPLLPGNADPFARVDAAVVARSDLTEKQRAEADSQENRLRSVLGLSFNDLATSEAVRGEYLAALGHYQEAERWDAQVPGLAKNLGLSAFRTSNYPEAIRGLAQAVQAKPADGPVRAMLGMAYFGAEKFADAAKTFSPLGVRGMQDSTVGYAWATSLARTSELKKAAEVLGEFEKSNRSNDAMLLIGQLWIEIGDYARAVAVLHSALQADPSLPKAHYFAGQADIRREHWSEAAAEFQAELGLVPSDADAKYNLGFVYLQQSRVDEAAALFEQVVTAHPDHANAQYQMGKILLDGGQLQEAVEHLEAATRLSPQTDYMHYQLQAAYRKESRIADADRELELYKELKAKQRDRAAVAPLQSP
jgi:tetratricopeptide (TPR) repeat protein